MGIKIKTILSLDVSDLQKLNAKNWLKFKPAKNRNNRNRRIAFGNAELGIPRVQTSKELGLSTTRVADLEKEAMRNAFVRVARTALMIMLIEKQHVHAT